MSAPLLPPKPDPNPQQPTKEWTDLRPKPTRKRVRRKDGTTQTLTVGAPSRVRRPPGGVGTKKAQTLAHGIRLPRALWAQVDAIAAHFEVTRGAVVKRMLVDGVARYGADAGVTAAPAPPRNPFDPMNGAPTPQYGNAPTPPPRFGPDPEAWTRYNLGEQVLAYEDALREQDEHVGKAAASVVLPQGAMPRRGAMPSTMPSALPSPSPLGEEEQEWEP